MKQLLSVLRSLSQIKDLRVKRTENGETEIYLLEKEPVPDAYLSYLKHQEPDADTIRIYKVDEAAFCGISSEPQVSVDDLEQVQAKLSSNVFFEQEFFPHEDDFCIPDLTQYPVSFENKANSKKAICHGRGDISSELEKFGNGDLSQFLFRAAKSDQKVVFIKADGSVTEESYSLLLERAKRIAMQVRKLPYGNYPVLMFQFTDNQDFIETFWGCVLSGIVPVPVQTCANYGIADANTSRVYNIWKILDKPPIITSDALYGSLLDIQEVYKEQMQIFPFSCLMKETDEPFEHIERPIDDLALIMFTSGSTGLPKGVKLSHFNLISQVIGQVSLNGFTSADISMNWMPLTHVGGIIYFHLRDVYLCALQVHVDTDLVLKNPLSWLDIIDEYRACITWSPNFAYKLIVDALERGDVHKEWDLSCMHTFLDGGEAVIAEVGLAFLKGLKPFGLRSTAFVPSYGMSETSSGVIYYFGFNEDTIRPTDNFVPVGEIVPGDSVRIVDEHDQLKCEGEIGRFQVKGNTITKGYFNNEKATRESYTEDGWFNTGDLAFIKDGMLSITGREKDVIIINGVNYYNHEIESELETLQEVRSSFCVAGAVTVAPGTPEKLLILYSAQEISDDVLLEQSDDTMAYIDRVNEKIRRDLAKNFNLFPHDVVCIPSFEILKTDIGKLQRKKMIELYLKGMYRKYTDSAAGISTSETDEKNKPLMTRIWQEKPCTHEAEQDCTVLLVGTIRGSLHSLIEDNYTKVLPFSKYDTLPADTHVSVIMDFGQDSDIHTKITILQDTVRSLEEYGLDRVVLNVFTSGGFYAKPGDSVNENAVFNGILQSYQMENGNIFVKQIDVAEGDMLPGDEEITQTNDHVIVYRSGVRYVPYLVSADVDTSVTQPITEGGLYLVTGITGGVGRKITSFLARNYNCRFIAVGRKSEEAAREIFRREQMKESVLAYRNIELSDTDQLSSFVADAEQMDGSTLAGILHFAGSVSELHGGRDHWEEFRSHFLVSETMGSFDEAFAPKGYAVSSLCKLLEGRPDCRMLLLSSVNAFFGGSSLAAYSGANSFLNEMALSCMEKHPQVYCINFANLSNIGMSADIPDGLKESSKKNGFYLLTLEEAASVMLYVLAHHIRFSFYGINLQNRNMQQFCCEPMQQRIIAYLPKAQEPGQISSILGNTAELRFGRLADYEVRIQSLRSRMPQLEAWKDTLRSRGLFASASRLLQPSTETEQAIYNIWKEVLQIEDFGIDKSYFTIGGNSLNSFRTLEKMNRHFNTELTIADFFTYNSVQEFAELLDQRSKNDNQEEGMF